MNKTIKYTFLEYEQSYEELLTEYLSDYFDVEETDFIESEISTYKICLEVFNYINNDYNEFISSYDTDNSNYPTPEKFRVMTIEYSNFDFDSISKNITMQKNSSSNIALTQRKLSFNKIIAFLENKKSNLEKQLPKKSDISKKDIPKSTTAEETLFFKNNFDNVNEKVILKYFTKNLVGKKYLTESELKKFLIAAFEKKTPATPRFNFQQLNTQRQIISVFYKYYKNTAAKPYGKKEQYAELLGEYFVGFNTKTVLNNFSK